MLCRGSRLSLFTLNGALLLDEVVCDKSDDCIVSCAFYEGANNEWIEEEIAFTGHKRGVVNVSFCNGCSTDDADSYTRCGARGSVKADFNSI